MTLLKAESVRRWKRADGQRRSISEGCFDPYRQELVKLDEKLKVDIVALRRRAVRRLDVVLHEIDT